ncbi:hypothetical protein ACQP1K_16635 [Sphaerimonospora sp. CA-214678]|uniref:hypothetical protein n=1 Tax=Sphaerimonospora sp. CA-214678 TaxID=3240029 RepID=UPI003D8FA81E
MEATKSDVSHISSATNLPGWQAGNRFPYFCGGINVLQTSLVAATNSDLPSMKEGASWQEVLKVEQPELAADFCEATREALEFIKDPANLETSAKRCCPMTPAFR